MTKWREDAQPEWPQAAAATGELTADGRARDGRATQVFPEGDVRVTGARLPAGTEILRGIPKQKEGEADSLPSAQASATSKGAATSEASRPAVRDPWQEPEEAVADGPGSAAGSAPGSAAGSAEHTHDPHEVTVQLDAVQLGDGFVRHVKEGPGTAPVADRPVFVDESGRRSRRFRRIGMAVALACGVYAVVIVATLMSGNSNAPWLPVPGQKENPPAGQVDSPSLPAESAPASDTGATVPSGTPAAGETAMPTSGPSALRPEATAGSGRPDPSAEPTPKASRTAPAQGGGGASEPAAPSKPADPPSTPATDPTPTGGSTPEPTTTTGTGDGGGGGGDTGTVAEGPVEPQPVTEPPAV
ncbi:hypothetical protein [Streptomyces dubilierae]|uniref:Translation initiation factor IF-2 n=1 Tax=Streptomyces dubilierae TaxID=3075533 RepID=A0ABU2PK75_9ACTN|nr:hypothetical protein [Streptomyces sp. DSM 41921]MDT0392573.1 hypothetical protein [Streptomyces sp. DSM 41921]